MRSKRMSPTAAARWRAAGVMVVLALGATLVSGGTPARAAAPDTRPAIVLVHGFNQWAHVAGACRASFGPFAAKIESQVSPTDTTKRYRAVHYTGFYATDTPAGGCPASDRLPNVTYDDSPANRGTLNGYPVATGGALNATTADRVEKIAAAFARWVYDTYTRKAGTTFHGRLQLVGYSLGGVIVRYAIQRWPLNFVIPGTMTSIVDEALLVGSPQAGAKMWKACNFFGLPDGAGYPCNVPCTASDVTPGAPLPGDVRKWCWLRGTPPGVGFPLGANCSEPGNAQCAQALPGSDFLRKLNGCDSGSPCLDVPLNPALARWWLVASQAWAGDPDGVPSDGLVNASSALYPRGPGESGTILATRNADPTAFPHMTLFNDPGPNPPGGIGAYPEPWIRLVLACNC